jgi:hypothetical protein
MFHVNRDACAEGPETMDGGDMQRWSRAAFGRDFRKN